MTSLATVTKLVKIVDAKETERKAALNDANDGKQTAVN